MEETESCHVFSEGLGGRVCISCHGMHAISTHESHQALSNYTCKTVLHCTALQVSNLCSNHVNMLQSHTSNQILSVIRYSSFEGMGRMH
jgi:hypothetical protein